jgi:hypothetical protein
VHNGAWEHAVSRSQSGVPLHLAYGLHPKTEAQRPLFADAAHAFWAAELHFGSVHSHSLRWHPGCVSQVSTFSGEQSVPDGTHDCEESTQPVTEASPTNTVATKSPMRATSRNIEPLSINRGSCVPRVATARARAPRGG